MISCQHSKSVPCFSCKTGWVGRRPPNYIYTQHPVLISSFAEKRWILGKSRVSPQKNQGPIQAWWFQYLVFIAVCRCVVGLTACSPTSYRFRSSVSAFCATPDVTLLSAMPQGRPELQRTVRPIFQERLFWWCGDTDLLKHKGQICIQLQQ
jgi:hypothetical protein